MSQSRDGCPGARGLKAVAARWTAAGEWGWSPGPGATSWTRRTDRTKSRGPYRREGASGRRRFGLDARFRGVRRPHLIDDPGASLYIAKGSDGFGNLGNQGSTRRHELYRVSNGDSSKHWRREGGGEEGGGAVFVVHPPGRRPHSHAPARGPPRPWTCRRRPSGRGTGG